MPSIEIILYTKIAKVTAFSMHRFQFAFILSIFKLKIIFQIIYYKQICKKNK